jgi:hypothetical protein
MKKAVLLLIFALLLVIQTLGVTYHASDCIDRGLPGGADINCVEGDDSRTPQEAQNPNTPWRTFGKLHSHFQSSGQCWDEFLLAKGGAFNEIGGTVWREKSLDCRTPAEGGTSSHLVIGSYTPDWASGDEERPYVVGTRFELNERIVMNGIEVEGIHWDGNNVFNVPYIRHRPTFFFISGPKTHYYLKNNEIENYIIVLNLHRSDGDETEHYFTDYHAIGNNIHHLGSNAFISSLGNNWKIRDNWIENVGCLDQDIPVGGTYITDCVHQHVFYINLGAQFSGVEVTNNTIKNSNAYYDQAYGEWICGASNGRAWGTGTKITGNRLINEYTANNNCRGITTGDRQYGGDTDLEISGNYFEGFTVAIALHESDNTIVENNVIRLKSATPFPEYEMGAVVKGINTETYTTNTIIRNNVFYVEPHDGGVPTGDGVIHIRTSSPQDTNIASNIVYIANELSGNKCFQYDQTSDTIFEEVDNNLCYYDPGSSGTFANWQSLSAWRGTGWDMNSLEEDPMFTSPLDYLTLSSGSPAINAGHSTLSATTDFLGYPRDSQPDIGAYEFQAGIGNTYYASDCQVGADPNCVQGDDSRSPTEAQNPNTPWRTFDRLHQEFQSNGQCGDRFLMAKGGSFGVTTGAATWDEKNLDCPSSHVVVGSYDPPWGGTERPLCSRCRFSIDDGSGLTIENIHFNGQDHVTTDYRFMWLDGGSTSHIYVQDNEIEEYAMIAQSGGSLGTDFHFLRNNIHHIGDHGFLFGTGSNWKIRDNWFENVACLNSGSVGGNGGCVYVHVFYINILDSAYTGTEITGNTIKNSNAYYDQALGRMVCAASNGRAGTGMRVSGNTFINEYDAHDNCKAWAGTSTGGGIHDSTISNNYFVGFPHAIHLNEATGNTVENNVIVLQAHAQASASYGIEIADLTASNTIRNNVIYATPQPVGGDPTTGIKVSRSQPAGNTNVVSNIVHMANNMGSNYNCFTYGDTSTNTLRVVDNNICFYSNGASGTFANGQSLSAWQISGWDMNSLEEDPMFTSPLDYLTLSSGSPAINAGHSTLSATTDFLGYPRDSNPDIGAYEYQGQSPGCQSDSECNDGNTCTTDTCTSGTCSNTLITSCSQTSDNCCPTTCTPSNDIDCEAPPVCVSSTTDQLFTNTQITPQQGVFTVTFDATPNNNGMDGITGLSQGTADDLDDSTVSLWFNWDGFIQARDNDAIDPWGGTGWFSAEESIPYLAGTQYHFRVVVDFPNRRYSAYVTPEGSQTERTIAVDRDFRAESLPISQLDNWHAYAGQSIYGTGTHTVCNFKVSSGADSDGNGCIDGEEITTYINRWYTSSQDVSMVQLVRALEQWKAGCS